MYNTSLHKRTLAQQVADSIKESVLSGELAPGDALPTEPALAQQFDVSRAVVRDAIRLLAALGLVDVRHGRGMYITEPGTEALGEALFIALRRRGASVWDVEELQQALLPQIVAFAAERAEEAEVEELAGAAEECLAAFGAMLERAEATGREPTGPTPRMREAYARFHELLYAASHNTVIGLLARPLYRLHSLKNWQTEGDAAEESVEDSVARERAVLEALIAAIRTRDSEQAARRTQRLFELYPPAAREAMMNTPIGERAVLPEELPRPGFLRHGARGGDEETE